MWKSRNESMRQPTADLTLDGKGVERRFIPIHSSKSGRLDIQHFLVDKGTRAIRTETPVAQWRDPGSGVGQYATTSVLKNAEVLEQCSDRVETRRARSESRRMTTASSGAFGGYVFNYSYINWILSLSLVTFVHCSFFCCRYLSVHLVEYFIILSFFVHLDDQSCCVSSADVIHVYCN